MNLLIVDDEVVTTEVLKEQIDRKKIPIRQIFVAYNAAMARECLEHQKIDIVLCDIEMPKESGLELLEWIRKRNKEIEFLFLTSHEKFEYAFGAVKNGAANYLLKPLDMPTINHALYVVTEKICKKRQMSLAEEYWSHGKRKVEADFWRSVLRGDLGNEEKEIQMEIERYGLGLEKEKRYTLVLIRVRKEAVFAEIQNTSLNQFILDNILAETFTRNLKMENVIHWEDNGEYYICAVSDMEGNEVKRRGEEVCSLLNQFYANPIYVGYISDEGTIVELGNICRGILAYDRKHMHDEGKLLIFAEITGEQHTLENVLDAKFIFSCLEKGERVKLLEYLQKMVAEVKRRDTSLANIQYFQMDFLQIIGVYLHKQGMDFEILFEDSNYVDIQKESLTSELSMIRWNAYVVNKIFDSIKSREKSDNMVEILVDYIRQHYEENITRNTLAEMVHFSPEYVGKTFKKQTGSSINDYVNQLRIEEAKRLLKGTDNKVIDIALMVGFENMPYFSSVFKKYTGCSPAEYKKIYG